MAPGRRDDAKRGHWLSLRGPAPSRKVLGAALGISLSLLLLALVGSRLRRSDGQGHGQALASAEETATAGEQPSRERHGLQWGQQQLAEDEARRVQEQCSGATWQQEYLEIQRRMRSEALPRHKRRFVTFTCVVGKCGGIGDLLIGLVSSFLVALIQKRALVVDYPYMDAAFEPASADVDWRMGPDVPMSPSRAAPKTDKARRDLPLHSVVYLNLHNQDLPADVGAYFDSLATAGNIRLLLNRGILVALFTGDAPGTVAWRTALEEKGLRMASAFGCILRFLLKETPEISEMVAPYLMRLHSEGKPSGAIGIHIRTSDARTWNVSKVGENPTLRQENVLAELRGARRLFACAWRLEQFFFGPGVAVTWVFFSSSQALKEAAVKEYGNKVLVTDIQPMHIELKGSDEQRRRSFQTTVAEWVLLSRCCSLFLFTESGFSKTAALHSLHPLSMHMFGRWADSWRDASWKDSCVPEEPTRIAVLGNTTRWSGV